MNFCLSLTSAELDAEDLQALTRDFCSTASRQDETAGTMETVRGFFEAA